MQHHLRDFQILSSMYFVFGKIECEKILFIILNNDSVAEKDKSYFNENFNSITMTSPRLADAGAEMASKKLSCVMKSVRFAGLKESKELASSSQSG